MSGHRGRYELREIVNAIFYQNATGCQWVCLPHDLPPKSATYYYFALWHDDGTDQAIHDLLRCQARERVGPAEDPTTIILDTQSIRAANNVPAATTGSDVGKKTAGRKRSLAVLRLITAVVVMAASATDNAIGVRLLDQVAVHAPTVTKAWVDSGYKAGRRGVDRGPSPLAPSRHRPSWTSRPPSADEWGQALLGEGIESPNPNGILLSDPAPRHGVSVESGEWRGVEEYSHDLSQVRDLR